MQEPAAFEYVRRNVLRGLRNDGKAREHRIAVVSVAIHRISSVGHFLPYRARDEFVLRFEGPIAIASGMPAMNALHFLKKQDVGGQTMQPVAQLVDHHAAQW